MFYLWHYFYEVKFFLSCISTLLIFRKSIAICIIFLTIKEAFLTVSEELFGCHCTGNSALPYYFCLSCPPFYNSHLTALPSTSWMLLSISGDSKCMRLQLDFYENASYKVWLNLYFGMEVVIWSCLTKDFTRGRQWISFKWHLGFYRCFWTVVLEKTLESPLDCKEIQPVHSEGNQPGISLEGMMLKLKL